MNGVTRARATLGRTLAAAGLAALLAAAPARAAEREVRLVAPGAEELSVSADGSVIAFSTTDELVGEDRNGNRDVYVAVRDGRSTSFRLISHLPSGQSADFSSRGPEISADGKTIAFFSRSDALVDGDGNEREDVFVANADGTAIERVNVGEGGAQADALGSLRDARPSLSADGSQVAFTEVARLTEDAKLTIEGNVYVLNVEAKVRLSTVDGTAKAGDDYTARSLQEVAIPAGQTTATFTVDTLKDSLAESDETVKVEIRGGGNISLGSPASATGTIQDPAPLNIARGQTVGGQVVAGTVAIRLPKTNVPLDLGDGALLPVGTIVDATEGTIELVSAVATSKAKLSAAKTQRARFSGGIFTIRQKKGAALVTLVLSGPELRRCPKAAVRRLQGDGKGAFAIRGRFASAAARSGRWLVEDRCAATSVKVRRGSATVRDLVRKRTKTVRSGRSLTVRKR